MRTNPPANSAGSDVRLPTKAVLSGLDADPTPDPRPPVRLALIQAALVLFTALLLGCNAADTEAARRSAIPADDLESDVLARWSGGQVTLDDLEDFIGDDLRELEIRYRLTRYERMSRIVDDLVDRALLEEEAGARGLPSIEALLVLEVEDKTPRPTRDQVEAVYPALVAQVGDAMPESMGPILREELWHRAQEARYRAFVGKLREQAGLEVELPYPDLPRVDVPIMSHDPQLGPSEALVTVVEFAEHTCHWCVQAADTVARIRETWPDEVRVVWKDFPLPGNGRALPAAVAAHCARDQGAFWEMRNRLLTHAQALGDRDLAGHAAELGLDVEQFEDCMISGRHVQGIHEDLAAGRQAGVRATPTFLVNGVLVPGVQPWDRFAAIIERELQRSGR